VPFDFQFAKSPSKFANVLDLSDFRYHNLPFEPLLAGSMNVLGAQTARMEVSTVGAQLGMYESNSREKSDIGSEKYVQLMNGLGFFAIYPTKIGLRLAGAFSQSDGSFKAEDSTSSEGGFKIKLKSQIIGVSVAGFLENGFGAAIRVSNFSEDLSGSYESGGRTFKMRSRDATYSHIQPQLMLNKEFGEFVFSWDRRLDHETAPKFGFYKLEYESRSAPMSGVLEVSRFRSSEGEGGNRDSWFLRGGVRHMFNDGQSNLKALLAVNDAFYIEPVDADPFSVSQLGVHVSGESVFSSNHLLSYGLAYGLGQGKGKTSRQIKTTLTQNSLALRAGYRLQLN
ncbi:MAG: hypothetical protein NT027_17610, partial [Proteobacteria bacterium]|nr:hypothetical protein [Pseudomonadota bacterium]